MNLPVENITEAMFLRMLQRIPVRERIVTYLEVVGGTANVADFLDVLGCNLNTLANNLMFLEGKKTVRTSGNMVSLLERYDQINLEPCIYLMFDRVKGLYKIGFSKDPESRLKKVQLEVKSELDLIFYGQVSTTTAQEFEKKLHLEFAQYRVYGEWFNFGTQDVNIPLLIERMAQA